MTIWLTADLHIGHYNIIRYCERPFKDLDSMHEIIISRWNNKVSDDDIVYILGDLGFVKRSGNIISDVIERLNGRKILIRGNHDKGEKVWYLDNGIDKIFDNYVTMEGSLLSHYPLVPDIYDGKKVKKIKEMLSEVYRREKCNFHYYAHTHRLPVEGENFMNVGMDLHDFFPVRYQKRL
jgi:calcineurin-like phosphoesterase family protein